MPNDTTSTARVREISVGGLFGVFDHCIPLNLDSRITFVHGVNGTGKTAILRMLQGLFGGSLSVFRRVPFDTFSVRFSNSTTVSVRREERRSKHSSLAISIEQPNGQHDDFAVPSPTNRRWKDIADDMPPALLEEYLPFLNKISKGRWRNLTTGEVLTRFEIAEQYGDQLPLAADSWLHPPWKKQVDEMLAVRLIQTKRLELGGRLRGAAHKPAKLHSSVDRYARDLAVRVQGTLAQYAATSQRLDRTFPNRILNDRREEHTSIETILERLQRIEGERARLQGFGFLQAEDTFPQLPHQVNREKLRILAIFADDMEKKFSTFGELASRVELFLTIMNNRLQYKQIVPDEERGFRLVSHNGRPLDLSALSSGEQHELVLSYEMLFNLRRDSLLLIDEPEISLHLSWQQQFLPDLRRVIELSGFDALVATHSADIIGDRWDLAVALRGPQ